MSKEEFAIFAMALKTFFPKDNLLPSTKSMDMWYMELQDLDYSVCEVFLHKWVQTQKFSPTISEIREGCANLISGNLPDWSDAWNRVNKAVSLFGFMQPEKAEKYVGNMAWKSVQAIGGWQRFCESYDQMADRANFRMAYEGYSKREKEDRQIPEALRQAINQIQIGADSINALPGKEK